MGKIRVFTIYSDEIGEMESHASSLDEETRRLPTGFYTTFNTLKNKKRVMGLSAHLERLYEPAKHAAVKIAINQNALRKALMDIFSSMSWGEIKARIVVSREDGTIYLAIQEFFSLEEAVYQNGVHVITAEITRHDAVIKDSGFILESEAQRKLVKGDVFEVLLSKKGKIYEGMTSNFYAVINGEIVTANRGVLLGVTRKSVLKIARGQGMSIRYRSPKLGEKFEEAFLTSSSRGIVPIVKIDEKNISNGRVGDVSKSLMKKYWDFIARESEEINVDG